MTTLFNGILVGTLTLYAWFMEYTTEWDEEHSEPLCSMALVGYCKSSVSKMTSSRGTWD